MAAEICIAIDVVALLPLSQQAFLKPKFLGVFFTHQQVPKRFGRETSDVFGLFSFPDFIHEHVHCRKTNMDPENDGLEEEFPFNYSTGLLVSMLVFGDVNMVSAVSQPATPTVSNNGCLSSG